MAGSLRYFTYEDDANRDWVVSLDESTYEQGVTGMSTNVDPADLAAGRQLRVSGKRPVSMRYAICSGIDGDGRTVTRKVYVGTTAAPMWQNPTNPASVPTLPDYSNGGQLIAVRITALIGEKRYFIPGGDTGIIDGDVDGYSAAA